MKDIFFFPSTSVHDCGRCCAFALSNSLSFLLGENSCGMEGAGEEGGGGEGVRQKGKGGVTQAVAHVCCHGDSGAVTMQ